MNKTFVSFVFLASIFAISGLASPDPERFAKDIVRFEEERRASKYPEGGVVCVGSSSMRMWSNRMQEDMYPVQVVPRGFGGSMFSDVNHYFEELVAAYKPRAVVVYEGDNDIGSGMDPEAVLEDFITFRNKVAELDPEIRVYVIGVKPSIRRWELIDQVYRINDMMRGYCEADEKLVFIDMCKALLTEEGELRPEVFLKDDLHLNRIGYNLWAAAVASAVVPVESGHEQ